MSDKANDGSNDLGRMNFEELMDLQNRILREHLVQDERTKVNQTLKLASELNEAVIAFRDGYAYGKSLTRALDKAILLANAADRLNGHLLEVLNDQQ
ncbi:hydrolase [Mycobacterium phage Erk16]|uniref:Hydrolase n=1 Tax=Mycobacterium phage Erk16 TaxID=2234027 RepID=A0A2Z4Q0Y0_9CAUD|nr:hydrolase [Mycobacterium phage Erk16]